MIVETSAKPNVHDPVFVEAEVDGCLVTFRAVFVNVVSDALWLGLIHPDPRLERVHAGAPVSRTFRRNGTGMIAAERFLNRMGTSQSRLFAVRWSDSCEVVQRREQLRLPVERPLEYVVLESEITEPGVSGVGVTRNLSAGGLQFRVERPIDETVVPDDLLELRLQLDAGVVIADGIVIRVEDATDIGSDGKPLPASKCTHKPLTAVAVQFESISAAGQDRIVKYMFSLQRMQRDRQNSAVR